MAEQNLEDPFSVWPLALALLHQGQDFPSLGSHWALKWAILVTERVRKKDIRCREVVR